jgi:predicted histidine transporter YuiF (NhaC family)
MGAEEFGSSAFWFGVITAIGAVVGLLVAVFTYRQNSKQSQQNFIEAQRTRKLELLKDVIVPLSKHTMQHM